MALDQALAAHTNDHPRVGGRGLSNRWLGTNTRALIEIRQKSDGRLAMSYEYKYEIEAMFHRDSLVERAERQSIREFDRELGVRMNW